MTVARELSRFVAPLGDALSSPDGVRTIVGELGLASQPAPDAALPDELATVAEAAGQTLTMLAGLAHGQTGPAQTAQAIAAVVELLTAVRDLAEVASSDLDDRPLPFDVPGTWTTLASALPALLLDRYLCDYHPVAEAALRAGGVLVDPDTGTGACVDFDALGALLADPAGHLADLLGDDPTVLLEPIASAAAAVGAARPARPLSFADGAAFVDEAAPLPPVPGTQLTIATAEAGESWAIDVDFDAVDVNHLPALRALASVTGTLGAGARLSPTWSLAAGLAAGGAVGFVIGPRGVGPAKGATAGTAGLTLTGAPESPWLLIGEPAGTRLELAGLTVGVEGDDLLHAPVVVGTVTTDGLRLAVNPGDGDSFLAYALGAFDVTAEAALDLRWSSAEGFTFAGGPAFDVLIPIERALGPLVVHTLHIDLAAAQAGLTAELGATVGLVLGPLTVVVNDMGLRTTIGPAASATLDLDPVTAAKPPPGAFGDIDLAMSFKPPTGAGFSIDLAGIVSGGGVAGFEPDTGRYWGGLAIDFLAVGLGAVIVVVTQVPGDPDAFALFASIFATFPPMPLGFGFFLSGVGGLLCLNRTMDTEALASGLKSGAVDAILFPADPLADAPLIVSQLDGWFPLAEGNTVVGVAATIDWGAPKALVTGQFGIVVSYPDLELAIMGSISMALPDQDTAELELHMDSLGTIDVGERTVSLVASLYDSSLIRVIQLSGDMAMYGRFGDDPYFLLSIGGYHPLFKPPGFLPASVTDLRRIGYEVAVSDDIWFGISGYVAVTSNTLQFGAEATIEAGAEFLLTTYRATGSLGFDVLLQFSPFAFVADAHAGVSVTAGGADLIAAELAVHLEGPKPWYATANGRFDFLGLDVHFDVAFGGAAGAQAPSRVNVLDAVALALAAATAWSATAPAGETVLFAAEGPGPDDDIVRARPDADLVARQTAAPLDRPLDVYGAYAIDGPDELTVGGAGIDGVPKATWTPAADWFAPAQFDSMSRTEMLSADSYEEMTAGASIVAGGVTTGAGTQAVTPDPEVRILDEQATRPVPGVRFDSPMATATAGLSALAANRTAGRPRSASSPTFAIEPVTWTRIDPATGEAIGRPATYTASLAGLRTRREIDPTARIAPTHAVRTPA